MNDYSGLTITVSLGIPLYRRPISGTAVDQSLTYAPGDELTGIPVPEKPFDEAEDIFLLLKDVLWKHPDARAVSSGAILSTYQRTRVESVAIRLGLVPLSYLWQYPYIPPYPPFYDGYLLDHMRDVKQKSIIIKVASGGLDESVLGLNVADFRVMQRLKTKMARFNPAVGALVGEGGEFETLALEGPAPLWKKRIAFESSTVVNGEGGSYALHLEGLRTEDFSTNEERGDSNILSLPSPLPLSPSSMQDTCQKYVFDAWNTSEVTAQPWFESDSLYSDMGSQEYHNVQFSPIEHGSSVRVSNILGPGGNAEEQMEQITEFVKVWLDTNYHLPPSSIVSTTVLLRSMKDFLPVNKAYSKLFTEALPPARVTVAIGNLLPIGKEVALSLTLFTGPKVPRQGLHVQGRSYWAPANIGPYSQAIQEPLANLPFVKNQSWPVTEIVHLAGQIPLVPSTMDLLGLPELHTYRTNKNIQDIDETVALRRAHILLALQNLLGVVTAMSLKNGCMTAGVAFFSGRTAEYAEEASKAWSDLLSTDSGESPDDDPVFPNVQWNPETTELEQLRALGASVKAAERAGSWARLSDENYLPRGRGIAPSFSIFISELPRNAIVEWWSIGLRHIETRWDGWEDADGNWIYPSISVLTGVRVTWICAKNAQNLSNVCQSAQFTPVKAESEVESASNGPLISLFAAAPVEKGWMKQWQPTLIPCEAIIHLKQNYEALILAIQHPSSRCVELLELQMYSGPSRVAT